LLEAGLIKFKRNDVGMVRGKLVGEDVGSVHGSERPKSFERRSAWLMMEAFLRPSQGLVAGFGEFRRPLG
jgi:hypothetical protein